MKINFAFCSLLIVLMVPLTGCLSEDIADPGNSIPKASKLDLSFKSNPNEDTILGTLDTGGDIPGATIDFLVDYNGTTTYCGPLTTQDCHVDNSKIKSLQINSDAGFPTCYEDCRFTIRVFYLGDLVATYEAINY